MHARVQLCQDPQTEFALLRESLGDSRVNHILRVHGHTLLQERRSAEIFDEVGLTSLERGQATLSAGHTGIGYKWARDIAGLAHLGALIAARPRILSMIPDAVAAGPLPEQPLVTCVAAVVEATTTTYHEALDDEDIQMAAPAADEAWQQTAEGHNVPTVTNPTVSEIEHSSSASQDDDDSDFECASASRKSRRGAPQLQAQLSRLSDRSSRPFPSELRFVKKLAPDPMNSSLSIVRWSFEGSGPSCPIESMRCL